MMIFKSLESPFIFDKIDLMKGKKVFNRIKKKIERAKNLKNLEEIFEEVLVKEKGLKKIKEKEKETLKKMIKKELMKKAKDFKEKKKIFDITLPGKKPEIGHFHPITLVKREISEIFQSLGFSIFEGPEIEDEWHNFDALNIPEDHPARESLSLGKTIYLKGGGLLRTHTSSAQIRFMEKNQPPFRIVAPGKVFRREATDPSHEIEFWQLEGLMVGKEISISNFKAIVEEFLKRFFKKEIKIRLRPSYFPFTEPSFEVDISCLMCEGKGCSICQQTGWLEVGGAGMVHQNVFKNVGYEEGKWQGFAFGFGINRLAMLKYKISDIRLFLSGDLRFIRQF